jgi:DNA-binding MarR family transcriptional regulator
MEDEITGIAIKMLKGLKEKPKNATKLAQNSEVSYGYALRIISSMKRKNMIQEQKNSEDRREKVLICTPRGIAELKKVEVKDSIIKKAGEKMKNIDKMFERDLRKMGLLIE